MTTNTIRDIIGQALANQMTQGLAPGANFEIDAYDSRNVDELADAVLAALLPKQTSDVQLLPSAPLQPMSIMVQGEHDYRAEGFAIEGMLVIGAEEGAIYVTETQARAFFDLVPRVSKTAGFHPIETMQEHAFNSEQVIIDYTNHRTERAERRINPKHFYFGFSDYHPGEQWLMVAADMDKNADRTFALKDVHSWRRA